MGKRPYNEEDAKLNAYVQLPENDCLGLKDKLKRAQVNCALAYEELKSAGHNVRERSTVCIEVIVDGKTIKTVLLHFGFIVNRYMCYACEREVKSPAANCYCTVFYDVAQVMHVLALIAKSE